MGLATAGVTLCTLLCAWGEVPVEAKRVVATRGGADGQEWAAVEAVNTSAVVLATVAAVQRVLLTALAPKQRAAVALPCGQRAAVEPGSCWAELGRGAELPLPRTARPARLSLAPHRLLLHSTVGSSSEPRTGSQPGASGGGES